MTLKKTIRKVVNHKGKTPLPSFFLFWVAKLLLDKVAIFDWNDKMFDQVANCVLQKRNNDIIFQHSGCITTKNFWMLLFDFATLMFYNVVEYGAIPL